MWGDVSSPASTLAWMAFAFALLVGFAGFYYELGEVVDRFTLLDVWAALLVFLVVGGARTLEGWRIDTLQAVANNQPAAVIFANMGEDLPGSLLQVGDKSINIKPVAGGFGDVYIRTDKEEWLDQLPAPAEGEKREMTWVRAYAWDGSGWYRDGTPLDQVQPNALRPLIVMSQSDDADELVRVVETAGGKALLLLRGEEVKANIMVPEELIYLEVTYLPIELATDMDLKTELWATANFREVNWGPTFWYGDTESEDLVTYLDDVFADTGATGLQLVLGDKGRVKDVANGCLAVMSTIKDGDKPVTNDKWCKISLALEDEVREAAMREWERPSPEHTKMSFGKPTEAIAGLIGEDFMKDRLVRELGAIDYCISVARDEGEDVNGLMSLITEFDQDGTISVELDERSRNTNFMVYRCVKDRFQKVSFTFDPEAWPMLPEPEEVEEGEEAEEVEPLPPETLAIQLDVSYPKL